jgi:hypothetical protein
VEEEEAVAGGRDAGSADDQVRLLTAYNNTMVNNNK